MLTSKEIRNAFLEFFKQKQHDIVPSAPIVVKDDPTLMFTNAGMNQFKDIFLGNKKPKSVRVADTQKCLRVSGKHNDLEEVGLDTYHHTMFEMLGNWSFGDPDTADGIGAGYFKKEAINWAWELLTEVLKIEKDRMYVTVFEGNPDENLAADEEAEKFWQQYLPKERILRFSKKDNFWEMGDTGPCGPCSEIHVDIRDDAERKKEDGAELVNEGHPHVIEIWNLVFIQYNRTASGKLEELPAKHVDTGMGFERLCMVLQKKQSNYDTDVFQPLIRAVADATGFAYGKNPKADIAMRVIADHVRTVAFTIADGQLPDRDGAGYVIRRILRRAVRYGYSYLNQKEAFIYKLLPILSETMGGQFPELKSQATLISKVVKEEEENFLRTLEKGITRISTYIEKSKEQKEIPGALAFELFDTYGFPVDLTQLIAREHHFTLDMKDFQRCLLEQKERSRKADVRDADDWVVVKENVKPEFIGYDRLESEISIARYRKVKEKNKEFFQLVFDKTPFYPEGGGQVGDTGFISNGEKIAITDTKKENDLIIHFADKLPAHPEQKFNAAVNREKRLTTVYNHSATHLLHEALRAVLGTHVEQRGSLVHPDYLRFDFSHFQKMTDEELAKIENMVNEKIQQNIALDEKRNVPFDEAKKMGAMALFGEKYGDAVRVIRFGTSVELCGGTHVQSTGQIGVFKITSESGVAAGIRRIEALTGPKALAYFNQKIFDLKKIETLVKNPDAVLGVEYLVNENKTLAKEVEKMQAVINAGLMDTLKQSVQPLNGINYIGSIVNVRSAEALKDLSYRLKNDIQNLFLVLGANIDGKPMLAVMIDEALVKEKNLHAGNIIRELAKEIQGGGGGQPFFATAGGKNAEGLEKAVEKAQAIIEVHKN